MGDETNMSPYLYINQGPITDIFPVVVHDGVDTITLTVKAKVGNTS